MARISRRNKRNLNSKYEFLAAAYLRLSVKDRNENESESIENQRNLINDFILKSKNIKLQYIFIDDGYTGTDFSRQGFNEMIKKVKSGEINCIIIKDLSRFGRNFEETENYIVKILPKYNVRLISIGESYDSSKENASEFGLLLTLKNLMNDYYAKDISHKVETSFDRLRREGKYITTRPPYGYLKSKNNKYKLICDESVRKNVLEIFTSLENDESYSSIAKRFNNLNISPPFKHLFEMGYISNPKYKKTKWIGSTVKNIAENPVYYGAFVINKHKKSLYKNISQHKIEKDKWEIIENTHEPIITKQQYQNVQKVIDNRRSKRNKVNN